MVTISTKGKTTTFTHGKYSVSFEETKPISPSPKKACFVVMQVNKSPVWRLHYYYTSESCQVEDIFSSRKVGEEIVPKQAAKELDFMMYCLEKQMQSKGIKLPTVRTHINFARFLHRRNWRVSSRNGTAYNVEKDLISGKIPAPSIMGGNWKKKRAIARRAIK